MWEIICFGTVVIAEVCIIILNVTMKRGNGTPFLGSCQMWRLDPDKGLKRRKRSSDKHVSSA